MSVIDLVRTIQGLLDGGQIEPKILDCATGEIRSQHLSAAKAAEMLDWKPQFDLEAGLRETIDWYRAFLARA